MVVPCQRPFTRSERVRNSGNTSACSSRADRREKVGVHLKPRTLFSLMLDRHKTNINALATELGGAGTQSQLHRFLTGKTIEPRRSTLKSVAEHWDIPLEAFYDEDVADRVAQQFDLSAVVSIKNREKAVAGRKNLAELAVEALAAVQSMDGGSIAGQSLKKTAEEILVNACRQAIRLSECARAVQMELGDRPSGA